MDRAVGRADTAAGSALEPQDAATALASGSLLSSLGRCEFRAACCDQGDVGQAEHSCESGQCPFHRWNPTLVKSMGYLPSQGQGFSQKFLVVIWDRQAGITGTVEKKSLTCSSFLLLVRFPAFCIWSLIFHCAHGLTAWELGLPSSFMPPGPS